MVYSQHPKRRNRIIWACLLVVVLILLVGVLAYFWPKQASAPGGASAYTTKLSGSVEGKYLFSGTVMLGRAVQTFANGDYNQPFSGMSTLGSYDANIGVLECPITTNDVPYETQVNDLIFNCQPVWLPYLKKYFPILNLSSDHLNDQGQAGIASTFQYLHSVGIQTVGNYNPHADKDDCQAVVFPVRIIDSPKVTTSDLPLAVCSYNYKIIFSPAPGELQSISKWSKIMPVIALMNGGPEYEHTAGPAQVSVAHQMIDYGADFVVGNGTHWVQNTEVYKGKLIVYSMGNFIFDQLDYDGRVALNLAVSLSVPYTSNLANWLSIGSKCAANTSTCLSLAEEDSLRRINPHYSFSVVGSYGGYQQIATKATAQEEAYIEQRANWAATESQLTKLGY